MQIVRSKPTVSRQLLATRNGAISQREGKDGSCRATIVPYIGEFDH
jgi:hypothetical protein